MSSGYEKKDVSVKGIVGGTLTIVVIIVVFVVLLRDYFLYNVENAVYNEAAAPSQELVEIRQSAEKLISQYGVIDKQNGIYQIPIDRAMELVVEDYNR
ncbi:MAG: hypothetical protein H6627_05680 [Calditrichae bacterium]|nr:hypothetical protein [Calditrichota bacterium]MCB9058036.1 hypothetical protein [Calditrichia bacterium]